MGGVADDGENAERVDPGWPDAWAKTRAAIRPA
jgi:hypothetical protein